MHKHSYYGKYQQIQRVGNGAYGIIYKIKSIPDGNILIAKHIALQNIEKSKALEQFEIIKKLKHEYIVKYIDSFIEEDELILIMQYCGGTYNLFQNVIYLGTSKKDAEVENILVNIQLLVLAVGFMHSNKIMHRDLKPQNIFVDHNMNLKVGDFGISRALEHSNQYCKTSAGTPAYMAPEMFDNQKYTFQADIWSLGCVIYEVCSLQKLFPHKDKHDKVIGLFKMMQMIKEAKVKDIPSIYSSDLAKLVKKMLTKDPFKRPRTEELLRDRLLVQLMINRLSQSANLKQEYPKSVQKSALVLTDSIIDKQMIQVKEQLKKFQQGIRSNLNQMKQKKIQKINVDEYYKDVQKKMKQIQLAVQNAFCELKKQKEANLQNKSQAKPKFRIRDKEKDQKSNLFKKQFNETGKSKTNVNENRLITQTSEDQTINSIQISQRNLQNFQFGNQSLRSENRSDMTLLSQQVSSIGLKSKRENLFQETIKSDYSKTIRSEKMQNQLDQLNIFEQTILKNPEALLSQSFLNCTLSISNDQNLNFTKLEKAQKNIKQTINLDLTKLSQEAIELGFKKKPRDEDSPEKEDNFEYKDDFQEYNQDFNNLDLEQRRRAQLNTMLSLYQQTLSELGSNAVTSQSTNLRRKYLLMSEIKEQSNQGGSTISRQNDSL